MSYLFWNTLYENHKRLCIASALFVFAFFSSYVTFPESSIIRKDGFSFLAGLMIGLVAIYVVYRLTHPKKKE